MFKRTKNALNLFGVILFWCWNVLAILVSVFIFGIVLLVYIITATLTGEIPLSLTICFLILLLAPYISVYMAIKRPHIALPLFFGVEVPIITLTLFRVFLVREMTFGTGFFLGSGLVAIAVFGWGLWKHSENDAPVAKPNAPMWRHYLHVAAMSVVLVTGLISAVLSALYAFPFAVMFLKSFFSFGWVSLDFLDEVLFIIALAFFISSIVAFFVFPLYLAYFYPKMWRDEGRAAQPALSGFRYKAGSAIFVGLLVSVHGFVSWQLQADYVQRLDAMTASEQRAEMENPEVVRERLLRGYLNEYRYLGLTNGNNNLINIYNDAFGEIPLGGAAQSLQSYIISPLLYKGDQSDKAKAGKLYSALFDIPIQRAEKPAITKALEATYNRDEVTAGLMNIGARNVYIIEQNITVQDKGDYAAIEIEEVYENQTFERQEIFYYFSLPEEAAITGLWIGQTPDRNEMDAFIVAPRGAAQKVYEAQVRRNIDPALLEQVGPGQYRLRVFPIPATNMRAQFGGTVSRNERDRANDLMRVHMRYVTPRASQGFALPELLEKRNVDWQRKTKRTLDGKTLGKSNDWMPRAFIEAQSRSDETALKIQLGSQIVSAEALPNITALGAQSGRYAVLVDTSYSMGAQKAALEKALADMNAWSAEPGIEIDYYVSRADGGETEVSKTFAADALKPFGQITPQTMLTGYQAASAGDVYDGVIVLMDQGRYASRAGEADTFDGGLSAPLWILHVGLASSAYDDDILDLIYRSGGGVAFSVEDLRTRLYFAKSGKRATRHAVWDVQAESNEAATLGHPDRSALAARQIIQKGAFGVKPDNAALDGFHKLATQYGVVSPYSSMIVLVNEQQKEDLKKASEAEGRFDRQGRSGEEILSSPSSPLVSGVPEPHEWLLIILSLLLLIAAWRNRDRWGGARPAL